MQMKIWQETNKDCKNLDVDADGDLGIEIYILVSSGVSFQGVVIDRGSPSNNFLPLSVEIVRACINWKGICTSTRMVSTVTAFLWGWNSSRNLPRYLWSAFHSKMFREWAPQRHGRRIVVRVKMFLILEAVQERKSWPPGRSVSFCFLTYGAFQFRANYTPCKRILVSALWILMQIIVEANSSLSYRSRTPDAILLFDLISV